MRIENPDPELSGREDRAKDRCFLALPNSSEQVLVREAIVRGSEEAGYLAVSLDERPVSLGSTIQEALLREIARADCIIADVTEPNPNVFFELGLAQAMGKGLLLISRGRHSEKVPFDLRQFRVLTYQLNPESLSNLSSQVRFSLDEYRHFPRSSIIPSDTQHSAPFFVDWDRLRPGEAENLYRELLAQMGFHSVEWEKVSPVIDLVAELPRRDPDGFEYRELWLVAMTPAAARIILEKLDSGVAGKIARHLARRSARFSRLSRIDAKNPVTFLVILTDALAADEIEFIREQTERRRSSKDELGYSLRFRIWDREYLTTLVHRYPQIGYKYFADEGRVRSEKETRRSYEDLYRENSELIARQAYLISELKEEKNRRIRAERDSVWRDISFSAAHKIGNPIFAIETDLDPLRKRIREKRSSEAEEVVENIASALEKAKGFVEQFKSLARAQEISPISTLLYPLLEDSCGALANQGIDFRIECPSEIRVMADPERLGECFDELVANACHWLDKPEKRIRIQTVTHLEKTKPGFLDSDVQYILVRVRDNGCGIQEGNKDRVFDAFFTTHDQGTGLGLALVRRIIDGHGGAIVESGRPGEGSVFDVYLPLVEDQPVLSDDSD